MGPTGSGLFRAVAVAAVLGASALVAFLLFTGGGQSYTVKARFINGSQLVKGNLVDIGGTQGRPGQGPRDHAGRRRPRSRSKIDEKLRAAAARHAARSIRASGLRASPGRYVQLMLPREDEAGDDIPDGGRDRRRHTTTKVDLDQFFNIFDRPTRKALQGFYKGGSRQYAGRGDAGQPRPDAT